MFAHTQLPAELWILIASFLPPTTLAELYPVNRVFLELAMEQRYRQVSLTKPRHLHRLERMRDSYLSKRICSLTLAPYQLEEGLLNDQRNRLPKFTPNRIVKEVVKRSGYFRDFAATLLSLSQVHDLTLTSDSHRTHRLTFMRDVWSSIGKQLQRLCLSMPWDAFSGVFPNGLDLQRLEQLKITVHSRDDEYVDSWRNFPQHMGELALSINHLSTSLRLVSFTCLVPYDFSLFFRNLSLFPALETLHCVLYFDPDSLASVRSFTTFLKRHSAQLKNLCLHHVDLARDPTWTPPPLLRLLLPLNIPQLETLYISASFLRHSWVETDRLLHHVSSTLKTLVVDDAMFVSEVAILSRTLNEIIGGNVLEDLGVFITDFTPEFLDIIASNLAGLRKLTVDITRIGDASSTITHAELNSEELPFVKAIRQRYYPGWRLREIGIANFRNPEDRKMQPTLMRLVAGCVPAMCSFLETNDRGITPSHTLIKNRVFLRQAMIAPRSRT